MKIKYERKHPYVRQGISVCGSCGVVVASESNHTKWHEELDKTITLFKISRDEPNE